MRSTQGRTQSSSLRTEAYEVVSENSNGTVIIVEDEIDIADTIAYNLNREGYKTLAAYRGDEGLNLIRSESPDLVILDLMLPGIDGLSICQQLKSNPETQAIPIIMLSAKSEDSDIVIGLGLGADDYIGKPFSQRELVARVKVALRNAKNSQQNTSDIIIHDELLINTVRHEVTVSEQPVKLTATEFKLLIQLAANPKRVYTREQLITSALGRNVVIVDRNVDVHIASLRHKLGTAAQMIETIRGVGYRFTTD